LVADLGFSAFGFPANRNDCFAGYARESAGGRGSGVSRGKNWEVGSMNSVPKWLVAAALLALLVCATAAPARACGGGSGGQGSLALFSIQTASIQNKTGMTANALNVEIGPANDPLGVTVVNPPTPIAHPFTVGDTHTANRFINFSGGNVPNNGTTQVTWESAASGPTALAGGSWMSNGTEIGSIASQPVTVVIKTSIGGIDVSLDNPSGLSLPYTNLFGFQGADGLDFSPVQYLFGLEEGGLPVNLLVASSGTLPPGLTHIADLPNIDPPSEYDGGIITINGQFYAAAVLEQPVAVVPEPSRLALLLAALPLLGLVLYRRHTRRCLAPCS
jgi:hypothetical protein